jgi:hypothetical protein
MSKVQQDVIDALRNSRWGYLTVGVGEAVRRNTADALVKKGICIYDHLGSWDGKPAITVIKLAETHAKT